MSNQQKIARVKAVFSMSLIAALGLVLMGCPKPAASGACVDFEAPLAVGTQYGSPVGQTPGTVIFTTNRIPVSIQNFVFPAGGGAFNTAGIVIPPAPFGIGQAIRTNNINLEFDFSGVGFAVAKVTWDYLDQGGFENISVNGSPVFAGELSAAPSPIGGANIVVTAVPAPGGKKGTVTLTGAIKTLRIGGQEYWIDNVCASK
jgi:hypothetical protein